MEPRHLACRAGLFAYVFCFLVIATPLFSAQNLGSPAKVMRNSPTATVREMRSEVRAVRVVTTSESGVGFGTAQSAAARPILTRAPYLPVTGALPLRFQDAREWPRPLSTALTADPVSTPPVPAQDAEEIEVASAPPSSPAVVESEPPVAADAETAVVADTTETARVRPNPDPTLLTADMVLGFLGNLPPPEARVSVRFEPAIPEQATTAATSHDAL